MKFSATIKIDTQKVLNAFNNIEPALKAVLEKTLFVSFNKHDSMAKVTIETPKKVRTLDQNAKFHAMCQELAVHTGNEMADVKAGIKDRAMDRGYPYKINAISKNMMPKSSASVTSAEMAILIDTLHEVASEFGYVFKN